MYFSKDIVSPATYIQNDNFLFIIAGPCSAETEEQTLLTAKKLKDCKKISVFRAGLWKPRTCPKSFQGVGEKGLKWLKNVKRETGLLIATEVGTPRHAELCIENKVDILWIGARTTCSPLATQEIADVVRGCDMPIFIKNPTNPEVNLWVGAIERFLNAGIKKIAAVHRGFYSNYSKKYKNIPDWDIAFKLKNKFPSIPLICDPSHIAGKRKYIYEISQIALELGYIGLMLESHISPKQALSDSEQQLKPEALVELLNKLEHSILKNSFRKSTMIPAKFFKKTLNDIDDTIEILSKKKESITNLIINELRTFE